MGGIAFAIYLGLTAADGAALGQHISIGIFSAMITMLAHSMMMFYFLGKGKAVREAAAEGGLSTEFEHRIARARRPVFGIALLAMIATMVTALAGASVDTGVLPAGLGSSLNLTGGGNIHLSNVEPINIQGNIRPLYNFEPPATHDEVHDAALQFVRKVSGFTKPAKANEEAFALAVQEISDATTRLLDSLVTNAPPKDREVEAAKRRARSAERYAA